MRHKNNKATKQSRVLDAPAITFVITSLFKGGAETQLVRLAVGLADRGWCVRIVTLMGLNDFQGLLHDKDIAVVSLNIPRGRYDLMALPRLVRIFRRDRQDIVCTFMFHANVLGRVAARLAKVPVVVSSIRNAVFGGRWADRLTRITDRLASLTTTNSQLAAQALLARGVVSPDRLRVVPNAIDLSTRGVGKSRRELLGRELDDTWLWLSVGRLEPQKGHEFTLAALRSLLSEGPATHLAIAGSGALRDTLKEKTISLGIAEHVTFLDYSNEVAELMAAADGLVLASRWEGLPNVILEACVAGLPVVATSVGGVPELIEEARTGFLATPEDPVSLTNGMRRLMDLPVDCAAELVARAKQNVLETYAPDSVLNTWEEIFKDLLEKRHPFHA